MCQWQKLYYTKRWTIFFTASWNCLKLQLTFDELIFAVMQACNAMLYSCQVVNWRVTSNATSQTSSCMGSIEVIIYQVSKLIYSTILLVKRRSRDHHEPHEVCKDIKCSNAHVLMPGGDKTRVMFYCRLFFILVFFNVNFVGKYVQ